MTLFEVGIIVAVVVVLGAIVLQRGYSFRSTRTRVGTISCANNVKQINLCFRIWEGDNGDIVPMGISVTNGGSMEMAQKGDVIRTFLVMSNELSTPQVLFCPSDDGKVWTRSFGSLNNSNISYFVGVDTTNSMNPQMILSGDSSFELNGVQAKSGLVAYGSGDFVRWSPTTRHRSYGNIGLADGSVQSSASSSLQSYLRLTGLATNRFAIP